MSNKYDVCTIVKVLVPTTSSETTTYQLKYLNKNTFNSENDLTDNKSQAYKFDFDENRNTASKWIEGFFKNEDG